MPAQVLSFRLVAATFGSLFYVFDYQTRSFVWDIMRAQTSFHSRVFLAAKIRQGAVKRMASLSFSCPQCKKQHDRIKPEMIGHKVRCQCGYVFRIGAKASKQPGVAEKFKRKKTAKMGKLSRESKAKPGIANQKSSAVDPEAAFCSGSISDEVIAAIPLDDSPKDDDLEEILSVEDASHPAYDYDSVEDLVAEMHAASEPEDTIMDAIPVGAEAAGGLESDPLMQVPAETLVPTSYPPPGKNLQQEPPLARSRTGSKSKSGWRSRQSSGVDLDSLAGPILTLALACIVIPLAIAFAWEIGRMFNGYAAVSGRGASRGDVIFGLLTSGLVSLMFWGLAVSMVVGSIVSILELTTKDQFRWPNKVTAIIAAVLLVALMLHFGGRLIDTIRMARLAATLGAQLDGRERPGITWQFMQVFVVFCQYAIVPVAVIVLSFCRKLNR